MFIICPGQASRLHLAIETWPTWAVNHHEVALREPQGNQHSLHKEQREFN